MTVDAPVRTHCPNCGAKLHRPDLSLCAYCATPLQLGGKVEHEADETAKRLTRLREHPTFAAAMAWTPRDPELEARARRARRIAAVLCFFAFLVGIATVANDATPRWPRAVAAALFALGGAGLLFRADALRRRSRSLQLLRRPALVVSRRSMTSEAGRRAATTYFFLLHFDDGSEGEFSWPGQGTMYEPMPNGTTGLAYTLGDRLLDFRKM